MTSFLELAAARYSLRKYDSRAVEADVLTQVLEAGRLAPTACNNQPQRVMVLTEAAQFEKIDACTRGRFGAPVVLMVCYDKDLCWKRSFDGASSGEIDAAIVTTHMMMAAQDLGLGTCWVMYFDAAKAAELFDLPANLMPAALLPVGYAATDAAPAAGHGVRMTMEEMLI